MLINQSTVVANRSIVGFPYEIRQPGSYQLSSNLKVPPGVNGIKISASFVSLDLNGFNISCVGGCSGSAGNGITDSGTGFDNDGTPQSGITIRNGAVVGFFFGIDLGGSSGSFIEKVTAQSNGFVGIAVGNSSIVKDCLSLNNGGDGIVAGLHGIVSGNVVSGNAGLNAAPETSTRLLFSFVTNAGGYETGLEIANISVDPTIGSKATQGTCALNFFGTGSNILPAPIQSFVTPTLPGGTVYTSTLSVITSASNFSGYVIALCNFKAQGTAFIAVNATVTAAIPAVVNP